MKRYTQLKHTADVRIRVYGKNLKDLYKNAAIGMLNIIFKNRSNIKPKERYDIVVKGIDKEDILVRWLSEILYLFNEKRFYSMRFFIKELRDTLLKAYIVGYTIPDKSKIIHDIKAVTYHNLKILKKNNLFQTDIIFDV